MDFENFNLHIERTSTSNTFNASILDDRNNPVIAREFQYHIDSTIYSRLEESLGKNIPENAQLIKDFGTGLFSSVFGGEILEHYRSKINHFRLKLLFNQNEPELLRIPWEFMFDGENFLAAYPRITLSRMIKGIPLEKRGKIKDRLKMLVVISSPLDLPDYSRLQIEREQMIILQAVDRAYAANNIEVEFLDEASLRNIQDKLDDEEYHILHYTGHGGYAEDCGHLLLEDDSGRAVQIDNNRIADLLAGYPSLRLVVLSGCQTAKTSGRRALSDLSTPLLQKKIPAVLAMQYSVADQSAIELAGKFYTELALGVPIDRALTMARKQLLINKGTGKIDFATPVLFADDPDCLAVEKEKSPVQSNGFSFIDPRINPKISLGLEQLGNQFIGRRKELRRIKDDFFNKGIRTVVLHGIGGIGKTVTTTRLAEKLQNHFNGVYAFDCSGGLRVEDILVKLNNFFKANGVEALEQVCNAPVPIETKINYLGQVLSQVKLLLIFDNFETLLSIEENNREIKDPELKKALKQLVNQCKDGSRFIFTSRYTFNLTDGRLTNLMDEINLGELSQPEALMVMNRFPVIAREDFPTKLEIYQKVGGHPYTINIFGKQANQRSVADLLSDLAGVTREMVEFTLLDKSCKKLTGQGRRLIDRTSVFKKAVSLAALEWMMRENGKFPELAKQIDELIHWGLIIKLEEDKEQALYQVHRLVKDFIQTKTDEAQRKTWLIKAAGFYEDLVKTTKNLWDHLDARELYFDAEEYNLAGDIVSNVMEYLHTWGFIELVRTLNEQTIETASGSSKARAFHHLGMIHEGQGEYPQALEKYNRSLKISEELGNKGGIAITLHQLGMIHQKQGEYPQALEKYNRSLKIKEKLGNKGGIAITLHQMGMIHQKQGDYPQALEKYNRSLKINEELGNKGGIAVTLHQLGIIHQKQGEYPQALEKYNRSLKIAEELGDKGGIAETLGQIGKLYQEQGDYRKALRNFMVAFSVFKALNSPNLNIVGNWMNELKEKVGEETFQRYMEEIMAEQGERVE